LLGVGSESEFNTYTLSVFVGATEETPITVSLLALLVQDILVLMALVKKCGLWYSGFAEDIEDIWSMYNASQVRS
jgi:hypothetical protein